MISRPKALPSLLPSELLAYILDHQTYSSTLVICQTRKEFIDSLVSDVSLVNQGQKLLKCRNSETCTTSIAEEKIRDNSELRNLLLIPTLHQLTISRNTHVVFIPTLTHLRAYLATFPASMEHSFPNPKMPTELDGRPTLLLIYGLLNLHFDTCEWSAQGLCDTLAGLIEAGQRSCRKVVVVEKWKSSNAEEIRDDMNADISEFSRRSIWAIRVPILHTSAKYAGSHHEEKSWSGRTTEIGRILARWFTFGAQE